jgi:hypothetical protein
MLPAKVGAITRDPDRVPDISARIILFALRYDEPTSCDRVHSMAQSIVGGSYDSAVIGDRF